MSDLNSKLRWLIALRLLIVVSISTPYVLYRISPLRLPQAGSEEIVLEAIAKSSEGQALQILVGLSSVLTLLFIAFLRILRDRPVFHAYLQFTGDLFIITLLLYLLGEAAQSFSILYFVIISVASVLVRRSAGIVVATAAFALYTGVIFAPSFKWFQRLESSGLVNPGYEAPAALDVRYRLIVHLVGFYAVAFLTSYLAKDVARAEEKLRARNLDLADLEVAHRDIVESISAGLLTTDREGYVTGLNRAGEGLLEMVCGDLISRHVTETGLLDREQWRVITGSMDGRPHWEVARSYHDRRVHLGLSVTLLRDGQGTHRGYIIVIEDLTDERRLREQLRVKDRMAAVGEMAAGLAHEVGNPLAAISGSVQVLSRSLRDDKASSRGGALSAQAKLLEITLKESQRLDRTVKSFLQLASSRERRLAQVDVAALIAEDVQLLRLSEDVLEGHRIEADLVPPTATIRADPDQIGQIFWNLARNALQAMPDGGTLNIRGRLQGEWYALEFCDTGSGMSEEEQATLFHPFKSFFDQGTGIGMAIVYRIVEEHGGKITADSRPQEGTVIRVELPVAGHPAGQDGLEGMEIRS